LSLAPDVLTQATAALTVAIRLALAVFLGGMVGYEREASHRPAGLRTHILVALGSALIMLVSIFIFEVFQGYASVDPGRIAAQVVSGIGFLGAGTIMREGLTIRGLTTAASLWVVAGIGLAAGAGYYLGAILTAVAALAVLVILSRVEHRFIAKSTLQIMELVVRDKPGMLGRIGSVLGNFNVNIRNVQMSQRPDALLDIELQLLMPTVVDLTQLTQDLMAVEGVVSIRHEG